MSENSVKQEEDKELGQGNVVAPIPPPSPAKGWVQFDDDAPSSTNEQKITQQTPPKKQEEDAPAVIKTESVQVNLERSFSKSLDSPNVAVLDPKPLRNVELPIATVEPIMQGFNNGDIIVTLLPVNTSLPWITPAQFRPELVPEELMAAGLTLTVEEYVQAMELLVNDYRFTMYNVCYKRVLVVWITVAFLLLIGLLLSGFANLTLFGLGIGWLVVNAGAIFLSMYIKYRLSRSLEKCLAHVNKQLLRHKIVIALDDRGKISCHKINLCFLYMDAGPCIAHLQGCIEQQERNAVNGWEQRMDITANDIVIQGSNTTRVSRKQERAALLYLRYISRWGRDRIRGFLVSPPAKGGRHAGRLTCPCQFIEDHIMCKPEGKLTVKSFFTLPNQPTERIFNACI